MDTNLLLIVGLIVLLAIVAGLMLMRRRRSEHLSDRFGPEYERTVERMGSRGKAEADLAAREQRVRKLEIVPLAPQEAQRFRTEWQSLQARFVDSPRTAMTEADLLVRDLMSKRGYPVADFETRAADISVDHPHVVEHYRAAHEISLLHQRGQADTEAMRQALVHYRALFSELLEVEAPAAARSTVVEERRETAAAPRVSGFMPDRAMARDEAVDRNRALARDEAEAREREINRDRERQREIERDRQRDVQRDRDVQRERQRER
jgi:LPXTG-motif cell wall-anchored protein